MTTLGRYYEGVLADAAALDLPFNALPGQDQSAFVRSNIPAWACTSDLAATSSGVAIGTRIWLRKGDLITSIAFVAGNTAENTPTHRRTPCMTRTGRCSRRPRTSSPRRGRSTPPRSSPWPRRRSSRRTASTSSPPPPRRPRP